MDVAAVQAVAGLVQDAGRELNASATRVVDAAHGFEAGHAGRGYQEQGQRLSEALDGVRRYLFGWANCTYDYGSALRACADSCVDVEQSSAGNLGAVAGAFQ